MPSNRAQGVQMGCEVAAFCLMLAITIGQFGLLDYFVVATLKDAWWSSLVVLDVGVIACLFWLLALAVRYQRTCIRTTCTDDSNIRYAFVGWLAYSLVLTAKICIIFKLVVPHLHRTDLLGPGALELTLSFSALVFLLLVLSHHFNDPGGRRQTFLSYLASAVTLDVIDSVVFLKMLLDSHYAQRISDHPALDSAILALACFNFILPTCSLYKLRFNFGLPRWLPLPYETVYSLLYFVTVNVPFLVIRLFVLGQADSTLTTGSVFMVKNVVMLIIGVRELWVGWLARRSNGNF